MATEVLNYIHDLIKKDFDSNRRIITFDEYISYLASNPKQQTRGSAQYLLDMMEHFGKEPLTDPLETKGKKSSKSAEASIYHFKLFDLPIAGLAPKLIGHENVQTFIYQTLKSFIRQGINNRLILLHGPNGSAKSTIVRAFMGGMERYSLTSDGAVYTYNWVFPLEKSTKSGLGLGTSPHKESPGSFANLSDEEVSARIPCDLKDHPLLLIPLEHRQALLEKILGPEKGKEIWDNLFNFLSRGDLCQRCKLIFNNLLGANSGDYRKVLRHIQVERYFYSHRYRSGLVTVEPQMHVDAQYNQLTLDKRIQSLPVSLQNLNFFTLSGDLIEGNRGIIEYSDLLKRPVDTFKYLLGACETGSVNIGPSIAYFDTVMLGSTNALQLDAFKEFPDFSSFKARIELIRVPYLLRIHQEAEIYTPLLPQFSGEKHVSPHVEWTLALWAVLTRIKKPNSINYPPNISSIISNLTPLEKAKLYDHGEMPDRLSPDDRKLLKTNLLSLRDEYTNIPYYEGRLGASVREIKSILFDAIQNPSFDCLSPLAVLHELEKFVKNVSEYDFLKQDVKDGFHDAKEFIQIVRNEYLNIINLEFRDCMGLYDSNQWEDFLKKYITHLSNQMKKEKIKNPITGRTEKPDQTLIQEFESIVGAPKSEQDLDTFRKNIISQIGAWTLDNPSQEVNYSKVFPQYWRKLENHFFDSQKPMITKMYNALQVYGTEEEDQNSEGSKLARQTLKTMQTKLGYCEKCASAVISFLMSKKY